MNETRRWFPVLLNLEGRLCVVIGGGEVALRKADTFLGLGAKVKVISPTARPELMELSQKKLIQWETRPYREGDLEGAFLCAAAADDPGVNRKVKEEAEAKGVLVNLADDPEGSDYQVPSFFQQGPLLIAVSTQGASPAVSRTLRRMLQAWLGPSFGKAVEGINRFREEVVKKEIQDSKQRVRFWEKALTPELLEAARRGELEAVEKSLRESLARFKAKED